LARKPLKVKRRKLPFKSLDELEKEARNELRKTSQWVLDLIKRDIQEAPPDPDEGVIEGSLLRKSLHEERLEGAYAQAIRDHNRREEHGAPNDLRQLTEPFIKEVIARLPWVNGRMDPDPARLRTGETSSYEEVTVPTHAVVYGGFDSAELSSALKGIYKTPDLIAVKGSSIFWCTKNHATCFAAAAMQLPCVVANVYWVEEALPLESTAGSYQDLIEAETLAHVILQSQVYSLPSRFEPIAEKARQHPYEVLSLLVRGQKSPEEITARQKADSKDQERIDLWLGLYTKASETNEPDEANRIVRDDPRWKRAEELAERTFELASLVEARWEALRDEAREALKKTLGYVEEDGAPVKLPSFEEIYEAAFKGRPGREDTALTTGSVNGAYEDGAEVEIRDGQGNWTEALVKKTDNGIVKVLRTDGQYRNVTDPTAIRRAGEGKLVLDKDPQKEYNKDMQEIRIEKFNVILPAGSNSAKIEHNLEPMTEEMNRTPLVVNLETWRRNLEAQQKETDRLVLRCHELAGQAFRPHAPGDCSRILFEVLDLPVQRTSASGKPSTDDDTLQALDAMGNPIAGAIMEARGAQSVLSQLKEWEKFAEQGSVQTVWNQYGQPHGRYTADTPNLQNRVVPIRETIEAPPGFTFLSNDLGQAEYVTWASLSGDPVLSASFVSGIDFHIRMYDEVMEAAPGLNLHTTDKRKAGKTINFALLYLMQPFLLSKRLGITVPAAEKIIQGYKARAALADQYRENILAAAQKTGQVSTRFGRTRFMPDLKKARGHQLHALRKTAWHHHNAGTAAEILKIRQAQIFNTLRKDYSFEDVRLGLQMHDELIFVVKNELVEKVREICLEKFHQPLPGFLPFKVDTRTGQNWKAISK
jgi:hypothetical protein